MKKNNNASLTVIGLAQAIMVGLIGCVLLEPMLMITHLIYTHTYIWDPFDKGSKS